MDLAEIITALRSGDPQLQIPALVQASEIAQTLTSEAVSALFNSTAKVPVAEGLLRFGVIVRPLLEELLTTPADDETKTYAAAVLFDLGSKAGLPHLEFVLESGGKDFLIAANYLAKAHVSEAANAIERILRKWDVRADPYTANALIDDLKQLSRVPDDLKQKLLQEYPVAMKPALVKLLAQTAI